MKNRSLILGACAVVFASASAFTFTGNLATPVYIKIKSQQNPAWHCVNTGLECSNSGSANCYVSVAQDSPSLPATNTNGRIISSGTCDVFMKNTTAVNPAFDPAETVTDVADLGVN
ncbi:DUF6520 family protein [Parachryseolinea silvisoli]|uniref:DUF6520 family protein n=1 Tax=Parachryseolinea silvisoli TaxID=2873601 RepID=UPI002265AA52|nr:DUF6520 family protein [Parachryseolinea silvisoli]MCD9014446.1 DUF6520 family protein [Parachryseolinea silvisoli]